MVIRNKLTDQYSIPSLRNSPSILSSYLSMGYKTVFGVWLSEIQCVIRIGKGLRGRGEHAIGFVQWVALGQTQELCMGRKQDL